MLYIQTSDKAIIVLRIRTAEEMAAKRARRKKRDREKAKVKVANDEDDVEDDEDLAAGNGNEWIARIAEWCVVRASGKIRSFSLVDSEDASSSKGVQVSVDLHLQLSRTLPTARLLFRSCWHFLTILSRPTPCQPPLFLETPPQSPSSKARVAKLSLLGLTSWICKVTVRMSAVLASAKMIKSSPVRVMAV